MDYAKSSEFHRFIIPDGCHWNDVRATVENVGSKIKGAFAQIEKANPPYSIKSWDQGAFINDPYGRNIWGTPPQGCADYAFQQHIMQSLNPKTGRCVVLWPHGILFRDSEREMRKKNDSQRYSGLRDWTRTKFVLQFPYGGLPADMPPPETQGAKRENPFYQCAG